MNKIYFLIFGLILFNSSVFAQEQEKQVDVKGSPFYRHYQMKYVYAMKYNDWHTAADALYDLIVLDPADDSLKVNLAYLYFDNNSFPSALFVSNDVLARNPNNEPALSISAAAYENMGLRKKAVENYESLYLINNDVNILFRVAAMQYELKRYAESLNNARIVAENANAGEIKLSFPKSETEQQEVPLAAAAFNLMGVIEKDRGNKAQAKEYFNKALGIAPEFQMVKDSLKELEE